MMSNLSENTMNQNSGGEKNPPINSLKDLIEQVSGKNISVTSNSDESSFATPPVFPFLAIIGQNELKLALTLSTINPNIGGVLLIGPRGTGKTTAIRGLANILPKNEVSACYYGCLESDIEMYGLEGVCPDCAKKFGEGIPLTKVQQVQLIELPLNSTLDNVIGGLDERHLLHNKMRLKRGVLASADKNILYIDEVNLLSTEIINAILDAAAVGHYTVRRGAVSARYNARFTLIGSMNPEEGNLRPQILDRFGLRLIVKGLSDPEQRYKAYAHSSLFRQSPHKLIQQFEEETRVFIEEIHEAKQIFQKIVLPEDVALYGIRFIQALGIDSLRTDQTLLETAKAYAAADKRQEVTKNDIMTIAPMVLRLRKSEFMENYFEEQNKTEKMIDELIQRQIWISDL
ncbi:MAG: magnesium chelatase [Anaerolineaceae bacterium]|nr:magnesium chelatase [Anaerolineaceae bacterium]